MPSPPTGSSFEASIRDDETLTASIVASAESVVEGSNTTFTVTLMGGVTEDGVSVAFEAGGTATEEDYGRPTGAIMLPPDDASGRVGVLEIRAGQTSGTITYPILLDNSEEDGETLDVEIYSVSSGAKAATVSSTEYLASTMILDRGTLIASIAGTPSPDEGQAGTFTIFISKTSDAPVFVNWATRQVEMGPGGGQVAREGVDLPATSGRVEIPAGSTSATFTASTTQDTLVEGDEIFGVTLEEAREDSDNVPLGVTSATGTIVDDDAAPAGLTISVSPTGVDEDAGPTDLTVTVELDGTTQFPVDTPVSVGMVNRPNVSNNATLGVDYTSTTANVEIPAGQSSATTTVTLTPVDDSYSEGDEIARLNARSPVFTDAAGRAVWIRDNDMEPVEVGLDAVPGTVIESASTQQLTVTATLMGQSSREIDTVVTVELADNTATVGEDFETATATLTIPAGEVSAVTTVTLTLLDDNIAEGAETLSVAGTVPGSIIVTPAEVTIVDDDAEPNAIGISVMAPPLNEGGATTTLPVRATLLGGSTRGVDTEVTLCVEDLTATVNDDYTAAWDSPVLTISAGDLSAIANLTLAPVDNTLHEEDEQLAVRGANTDPGLPVNGVQLTIEDDDPVPEKIILTLDRSSVPESYGTVLSDVTATLDGGSTIDSDAEISITVESNAQETRTYGGILQDGLSIEAGQSSGTTKIYVAGLNDDVDDDEVIVMVRGTTDTSGLTIKAARLRVSDDDTSGVRVSPTSLDIQEGRRGQYSVSLTSEPTANVVVTIDVPANAGFTVNPGILTFTPLSWGWQNVYVDALVDLDGDDEPAADITHSLGSTDTKYDGAATENVSVTVRDTTSSTVRVEPTELDIAEGASSTYTVILDTQPTGDVTVTVEGHSGTGVSVDSPILTFTTVNWATPQDVTVTANQDDDAIDESVTLTNTVSGGGYGSVIAADVDVEVTDDDDVGVTVSPTELTVIEGQEGGYTVVLTSEPAGNVTVTVNDPGNTDVTADPAVLTFTPTDWDDEQTVTVTAVIDNDTVDDTATVTHTVESTGDSTYDGTSTADVTVTVEELQLVTVSFEQAAYTVAEGGTVTVRVQLSADPERTVTIPISSTNQDGATGADYSGVPANVVFNSGDTEKDITFTATQDTIDDDDESVKLTFGTLPTGVSEGNTDEATVSISDDDVPSVDVSFEQGMYTVAEGGSVTVKVKLDADPERTVSIPISKTDQGGASNSDYSGVPTNVVFDSGDTEQTFTFIATQDTVDDDGESVKLTLSSLPEGVTAGSPSETVVSITDDDVPDVMVSFGASSYTVAEGGSVTVTVKLGADPERIVEVPITVAHLGGASSTDFSGVPDTVTFQPGDTEETFDFTATHDTVDDDDESVKLTFGSLPARVTSTGPSQAIVSITDDDVPEVTVSFEQESYTVAEGGTVTVKVQMDADPERMVTIPLTKADQDGASNSDYSGVPANVVFDSGDTEKMFTFTATSDNDNDDDESVKLGFGTLPTGVSTGSTNEATVSITDDDVPDVTVSFSAGSYSAEEGGTVEVTLTLSVAPERAVTIPLTKTEQGGATSTDYSGVPADVRFGASDTEQTFTFTAADDTVNDDGESVKLGFGTLPTGVSDGTNSEATVNITDGDVPTVNVSFEHGTYTIAEGATETIKVKLSAAPERSVTISILRLDEHGATSADYSGVPSSVTFNSGDTEKTFTFTAESDNQNDDGESVRLSFGSMPAGVNAGTNINTTISITDDDVPDVSVSFATSTYAVAEGSSVMVKVRLSADPERSVTIPLTSTEQGGASNSDYSGVPTSVTIASGDTEVTFAFAAATDSNYDDGESVKLTFGTLPAGVSGGSTDETTISITDDAPAVTVSFGSSSYTVAEGSSVTVKVKLSADPERDVEVPITVATLDGASSADFSGVPSTVMFESGDTEKTFSFSAIQDTVDDDGEKVSLTFGMLPGGVTSTGPSQAVVSITDDDPAVTVRFQRGTYTVIEGGSINITVIMSPDPERTIRIPLRVMNQGGATDDDHSLIPEAITFNAGQTSRIFTFQADEDTIDDDGESVKIGFYNTLPTGVSPGTTYETVVSITDDDVPAVTVSYGASSYTVTEGSSVAVKVKLSADPERTVEVPITVAHLGGASSTDFSGVTEKVTFSSGDTEKTFLFSATQDTVDDDGEKVSLTFGTLPTGVSEGSTKESVVSITDDDVLAVTVSFSAGSYSAEEGGTVEVTLTLSAAPGRAVTIPLTKTEQGGASNSDYSGVPTSISFGSGDTDKTFAFTATSDNDNDDDESVKLGFGTLPTGVSAGSTDEATVSITDNDYPFVTVSFEQAAYTVVEGATTTIRVTLSADPERSVTIPLTTAKQGGASNSDYSGVPASVVFDSGDTQKTLTFTATQDSFDDDGERVRLGFGSTLPPGVSPGTTNETTVSITDDDDPQVTVSFEHATYTVAEGATTTITIRLSADPERTVSITILKLNQGGASPQDYSGVPTSVMFNSGDTVKTFGFGATQDEENDNNESVRLTLGSQTPPGVGIGTNNSATVSITDDDVPDVKVSYPEGSYTVTEGATVQILVALDMEPERQVVIPVSAVGQNGATTADYLIPASVTFNSGDIEKTFVFSATQDTDDDDPRVSVSFEQGSYTVEEGGSVTVKVKLSADPERSVTISILKLNQDGAGSEDYSGVPTSVTFNSGDTEKTFSFSATQDTTDDDGESVKLSFGARPPGVDLGAPDETTVSITDDDVPDVSVSFATSTYSVAEGATTTIEVVLSADPERIVSIPITSAAQGGATSTDYSGVPSTIRFNAGDTRASFVFSATQDDEDDNDESVKLTLGGLPGGVSTGTPDETTVSIVDDDAVAQPQVAVRVSFDSSGYGLSEGGTAVVTLTLDADPGGTVVIPITSTRQGGATSADYSGVPTAVTFNSGDTTKSFTFTAVQDDVDEDDESVLLGFGSLPTGVSLGTTIWSTTVTITDDDTAGVTLGTMTLRVDEGAASTYTVVLTSDPEGSVTVTVNDPTDNTDVTTDPANLTFTGGTWNTEQTVTVSAADDNDSVDETATITHTVSGYGSVTAGDVQVTVLDDEDPTVTADFEQSTYMVAEGSSVTVKVTLSADPERTVTIPLSKTDLGGATSTDYTGVPGNVVFNSGDTEKTFDFSAATDSDNDDGESVKLGFGTMPAGVSGGSTDETTVTITDDDVPAVEVSFEQSTYTAAEGSSVTVKVKLSADPERTVTIPLTKANQGGATSTDYSGVPANVVFNGGDTEKSFSFSATQDTTDDDDESVKIGFGTMPTGVSGGSPNETTVSITDDDHPQVTVGFEQGSYTVAEGGSVTVKVKLSAAPEMSVTIPILRVNQDGASSVDYSGVPASVTIASGDTEVMFTFIATQDTDDDDGESVKLTLGSLPTRMSAGTNSTTVSITDDDVPAVSVSFEQGSYTAAEGGSVTVKVKLDADPERTVTIPLSKTDQGGASSADYSGVPANVVFNSGNTEKTFIFTATQDTSDDDGESVKLGFGSMPTGVGAGTTNETTVSITDDDVSSITVGFEQGSYTAAEGGSVTVKVKLSVDPGRTITIPLNKTEQGGATSTDYSGVPANVTFNSGDTEKTFSFSATQDTVDDDGESVKLGFGTLPTGVDAGTTNETTVTITDDDVPSVSVSFEQGSYTAAEGSSVTVKVGLSADPERDVTISVLRLNQHGATSADYSGVPTNVTIASGDTEVMFDFTATDDSDNDDGESVRLTLSSLPAGVTAGTNSSATFSIADDDETTQEQTSVQVSYQASGYVLSEGLTAQITVLLSADPGSTVTIPLSTTTLAGVTSADYSGVPSSVSFDSGETNRSFTFTAVQDDEDENPEEVTLGFGTLPSGVSAGIPSQATVTILDSLRVSFDASGYEAYEGGAGALVTVQLDSAVMLETVIPLTAVGKSGATEDDWTGVPEDLTFSPGDQTKAFTVMAYNDTIEDDGEIVELGFGQLPAGIVAGSPSTAYVVLMNTEVPTCDTAVWCASVEFADSTSNDWGRIGLGFGYHPGQDPYHRNSSLSDDRFTFREREYRVWNMFATPAVHPQIAPRPTFGIPERSEFSISIHEMDGDRLKDYVPEEHFQDWVLYIADNGDIGRPFLFSELEASSRGSFVWLHPEFHDLVADWEDGNTYQVMIGEDWVNERPEPAVTTPMAPRYLRVVPGSRVLTVIWKQPLEDGNSDITHYRLQWKLETGSWEDRDEVTVQPFGGALTEVAHVIDGLVNYDYYTVRVIAVNEMGDSEPSTTHFGMPQEKRLDITDAVVDGGQLTITYERTLDGSSVPGLKSFWTLVNGAPREVTGVSISGQTVVLTLDEPDKRSIRSTDEVHYCYRMPASGSPAIKDSDSNYALSCEIAEPPQTARNETDPGLLEPVTAEFTMMPASHSGTSSEVTFHVEFSEPVRVDMGPAFAFLLEVTGGDVTSAWWMDRDTTMWKIVLQPDSGADVTIRLPADRACDARGAPCASGERRLTTGLEHTIPGPG